MKVTPAAPVAQAAEDDAFASARGRNAARELEYSAQPGLRTVYFDYDRHNLRPETRKTLENNASFAIEGKIPALKVEGHCDQRGTVEYNLALGQKRANSVKDYYTQLGYNPDMVTAVSYGKERPVCDDSGESCWQQNRRAVTLAGN
ncbi:MAG: OmpA family protein [Elusimicrobia bacterium]|nr:OmpA family protein [Elusimicrobiota bacterium]